MKFGNWCKNPEITKNWTKTDHFLNNRELYRTKTQIMPLKVASSIKNMTIILTLYSVCDLTLKNPSKDYFNMDEIRNEIMNNLTTYKLRLRAKGLHIVERINKAKYKRATNKTYDYKGIMQREKQELINKIEGLYVPKRHKDRGITLNMHDLYYSLAILWGIFLNIKSYSNSKGYSDLENETNHGTRILYYLNEDGKQLLKKYKENKYLF